MGILEAIEDREPGDAEKDFEKGRRMLFMYRLSSYVHNVIPLFGYHAIVFPGNESAGDNQAFVVVFADFQTSCK